jgi:hypothetical protein
VLTYTSVDGRLRKAFGLTHLTLGPAAGGAFSWSTAPYFMSRRVEYLRLGMRARLCCPEMGGRANGVDNVRSIDAYGKQRALGSIAGVEISWPSCNAIVVSITYVSCGCSRYRCLESLTQFASRN